MDPLSALNPLSQAGSAAASGFAFGVGFAQGLAAARAQQPAGALAQAAPVSAPALWAQPNQLLAETMMTLLSLLSRLMSNGTLPGLLGSQGLGGAQALGGRTGGNSSAPFSGSSVATPTVAGGPKVQKFIDVAMAQQGDPYVFGATGPDKFDCSGLVYYSLRQAGANVPRLTAEGYRQRYKNSMVDKNELRPGDLVFFWSPNSRGIPQGQATHIEIYIGNGQTMGTDSPSEGARVEPVNWKTFIGAARPTELYQ